MDSARESRLRLFAALIGTLIVSSPFVLIASANSASTFTPGEFYFSEEMLNIPPHSSGMVNLTFVAGEVWVEIHCGDDCLYLSLNLTDSEGSVIEDKHSGEFRIIEGDVAAGNAVIHATTTSTSGQPMPLQSVLPIGNWEAEEGDAIPNPGEDASMHTVSNLSHSANQTELWATNLVWFNGSISGTGDIDIFRLKAMSGDVFEIWLDSTNTGIKVEMIARGETQLRNLDELIASTNSSIGDTPLRTMVSTSGGEELWIRISSEDVTGQYSMRVARHMAEQESITYGEFPNRSDDDAIINAEVYPVNGWLSGFSGEEDCFIMGVSMDNQLSRDVQVFDAEIKSTLLLNFDLHYMIGENWIKAEHFYNLISTETTHSIKHFSPHETTQLRLCLFGTAPLSWHVSFNTSTHPDSHGELPSNSTDFVQEWDQMKFNNNTQGDLLPSIYDSADILWFELEGWPESEFLVRLSVDNLGEVAVRVTLMEVNWTNRDIVDSSNITVNASQAEDLTLKVGPGIHAVKIEHVELIENSGNWTWGQQTPMESAEYQIYATKLQTEEGEEPWFAPDPRVGEASDKLLMFFGVILLSPFLWIVYKQRTQRVKAQRLIGQKARLSHLLDLLSRGEIKEARADLAENLQIISTLTWEEGIAVWGNPDVHHRTGAVDLAAWQLDKRLAKKGGLPILIGIHVVTDTWEVAGLRCEAPEGMAWEIVGVEPRLLFREDEIFLDQLHSGTRIFIEVELIGNGSGFEFSLSGTVKGEPSGMKTTEAMGVNAEEE